MDIKEGLLSSVDYELEEEELYRFDERSHSQLQYGHREIYLFEMKNMEVKMQVDIVPKAERSEAEGKHGELKVSYTQVPGEFMYRLSVFVKDDGGNWRDSSAFESSFE